MQWNKIIKVSVTIFISIVLITSGLSFYMWNVYYNKKNLLHKYNVDNSKEVYILGSIGKKHFGRCYNYSMKDLLNVMDNINPDVVLLSAREDHLKDFGIIDGDIDTCVAYSYCLDNNIPVKFIDWWIIDNISPNLSTAHLHDDNIFIRISRNLREIHPGTRVLVIVDSKKFYEQNARFDIAGYKRDEIKDVKKYFKDNDRDFEYPKLSSKIWRDRVYFYAFVFPRLINGQEYLFDSVKEKYINVNHDKFYKKQVKYCKYINDNALYK